MCLIFYCLNACCSLILGDKYINGEIIPCKYPTYQPKRSAPKNESRRYERSLMENLTEDAEKIHEKVVGSFVRIRISSSDQKQDMYRLVQVVGK